jgi:predicted aspartyl protease
MVSGIFIKNTPFIAVTFGWGGSMQASPFVLDTGFTGDLQVTPETAKNLGLEIVGVTKATIANGQTVDVFASLAIAQMEGVMNPIQVLIANGTIPLMGISLMTKFGYKAVVDCKYRTVQLEKA